MFILGAFISLIRIFTVVYEKRKGVKMFDLILYTIPVIVLVIGLLMYFIGSSKKNNILKGVGIGFIICLIVLESPNIIQGFIEGFTEGYSD